MTKKQAMQRGFTLIELLLSLTIMMVIFVLGFQGYRLFNQSWQKDLSKFEQAFTGYKNNELFTTALYGIIPYMVKDGDKQAFYFLGRAEGFTAVTSTPVFNPGYPAVIRVFREAQPDGLFRLVYEEASLQGQLLLRPGQTLPFQHRLVLQTDVPAIGFRFYGMKDRTSFFNAIANDEAHLVQEQWFSEYDGLTAQLHPSRLQILLDEFDLTVTVPARSTLGEVINPDGVL